MRIGVICEFVYGDPLPKQNRIKGEFPVYGSNGQIDFHNKSLTKSETIIIGRKGSIGEVHFSRIGCWVIDTAYYVKPLIEINIQYLYLLLKTLNLSKLNKASSIPGLNRDDVYKIEVNLSSLDEQKRIVKIVEKNFISIEKAKNASDEQINIIESLEASYFQNIYNNHSIQWKRMKWDELFNVKTGKLNSSSMVENGEYPFFTCSKEIFRINKYDFDCEALLLSGNNAAGIYDVKYYKGKFNAYQRTYILTLKDKNNNYQLFKYFLEQKLKLMRQLSKGSNTRFLTTKILSTLDFLVPLKSEQEVIINNLKIKSERINTLYSYIIEQSSYINALPSSILRKAFNGDY
jgi:type I restriction enzyme, S subunit